MADPPANTDVPLESREDLTRAEVAHEIVGSDKLEQRNRNDDERQDKSDRRQDRHEKRLDKQDVTLHDVLYLLDGRMGHIETAVKDLTKATNHRMEAFEALVVKMDAKWLALLSVKADRDELLTSWGERLLRNRAVRWVAGMLFGATLVTAAIQHWFASAFHFIGRMFE